MPLLQEVIPLNREIARFGPTLMNLDSIGTYQTAPLPYGAESIPANCPVQIKGGGEFVLGILGRNSSPSAFMVVNRSYRESAEAEIQIALPGRELQEFDRNSGKWSHTKTFSAPRLEKVHLAPGDGRLFRVVGVSRLTSPKYSAAEK